MHRLEKRNLLPQDLKPVTTLEEYKALGGLKGLEKARSMTQQQVIDEVKKSNLRGRGGAGFPAAIKWQTVKDAPDEKKFLVCNGSEGEPGTFKDRYLLSKNPYYLFEGMLIAAYAIGAKQAVLGIKKKYTKTLEKLYKVREEYEKAGVVQPGYLRIVEGPDEYLFGEEKALLEVIDGRGAMPRFFPPFMMGINCLPGETNPTVVNNIETLCHLPKILLNGADWFKSMGSQDTPGTVIMTVSGDVKRPGVYEVETGLTVHDLLYDLAGGPLDGRKFRAMFSGFSTKVMTPEFFNTKMDFGSLRNAGFGLGSCGYIVYDDSRCMVELAWLISKFLSISSCGQCIPCNSGTRFITEHLDNLEFGTGSQHDLDEILNIAGRCTQQTRCFLPQQEQIVVPSLMKAFPQEFAYHAGSSCNYHNPIMIPKIKDYDEAKGEFVFEDKPKEYLDCPRYFARFAHR